MEFRLVLNNRTDDEITNNDMSGRFHQQLKYYKYRRVPSKNGKAIFYLFFRKDEETYAALRVAKSIKEISLVRYYPSNPINSESSFRPFPPQQIIDICRYTFRSRLVNFENVEFFKAFIRRLAEQMMAQNIKIHENEVMGVKNKVIDITDEFDFDFEMDKNILHKDPNLYTTFFSPISNATSQGEENNKSSDSEDQDESCDVVLTKCLTDISEIVQYLKEGIIDY
ncbi:unnamed protein product [Rotaria magnacalcarata]|uniref:Uncharacterized protein n=2 Tax=Rotaria magnacalcarata TaxID=392030 RepID=A0A815KHP7_9BILA|nr:unnamed protein product [Rotaria magnacalcarata]